MTFLLHRDDMDIKIGYSLEPVFFGQEYWKRDTRFYVQPFFPNSYSMAHIHFVKL